MATKNTKVLAQVAILFKPAAREQIKEAAAKRGLELSEEFDTVGQIFDAPREYSIGDGTVDVVTSAIDGSGDVMVYSYPLTDVSRIRSRYTEAPQDKKLN